ncbi:hypothetical protein QAD02_018626 [Eretmocerus hayati]|uniref:Uncharacterized protein n=1 Tax=Eretmocerus hayati TaxID=131215 RepID=A0ACC2PJR6_9HYME|nr:hypothetical protein QAD02_018626 [Eretmocerus hayati]
MPDLLKNDPQVSRFFKGVLNEKPKQAQYDEVWDPDGVLKHLSTWGADESLNLEKLTLKVTTLLALATAQRIQTLSLMKLNNIKLTDKGYKIFVPDRIKTTNRMRYQPVLQIPFLDSQPDICPAKTSRAYIDRTYGPRTKNNCDSIF